MRRILLAAALTACAVPALAQTTSTSPAPTTAPKMDAPVSGAMKTDDKGMTTVNTSTMAVRFITSKPTDMVTSRLKGVNVYNNKNENLGEIEDFVITDGKTVNGVIISVGGFLGMGERYIAVDPSNLVIHKDGNTVKAMLNTSKDDLSKAPTFDYSKTKS
ncbi:PRC-barrel domain containing protein [Methylobacterium terricola]|uniref:PRC-barrel domain containing protein n=1 Tax=Methylobacterium terricola TaxID=2583531 RepID=A0A5C4LG07_9HYPH|nr:PRC-barrel domain-containing protein [Methylobacterium terricola]TNC12689.1 PRC-barrel domain containing protein [Methylobacterium terricola]